jgi:predicted nucleic acid-binding protein
MLTNYKVLGIDTSPFIYHFQGEAPYSKVTTDLFNAVEKGMVRAVTSVITLLEVLVKPISEGNLMAAEEYSTLLRTFPNLKLRIIDDAVASRAASLRASYGIRVPDALQLGVAIEEGAKAFVTNDERLRKVADIQVLTLKSFLSRQ